MLLRRFDCLMCTSIIQRAGNPFDLPLANANFEKGFNRFYDYRLAQSLSTIYRRCVHNCTRPQAVCSHQHMSIGSLRSSSWSNDQVLNVLNRHMPLFLRREADFDTELAANSTDHPTVR